MKNIAIGDTIVDAGEKFRVIEVTRTSSTFIRVMAKKIEAPAATPDPGAKERG